MNGKLAICALAALVACNSGNVFTISQTDPFYKVLYTDSVFVDKADTICVARGENATFQFVLQSSLDVKSLSACVKGPSEARVGWVHDVHSTNPTHNADDIIVTVNNDYPDPIFDDWNEEVSSGGFKTIRADVAVARDMKPGVYRYKLEVRGSADKRVKASKVFYVKVYPVTLPQEQTLKVVNWFTTAGFKYINDGQAPVEAFSDNYYDLFRIIVKAGVENGQNCWLMNTSPVPVINEKADGFTLDFTDYDKSLEILEECGSFKFFCNKHFGGRRAGSEWDDEMVFYIKTIEDGKLVDAAVDYQDPRLKEYIDRYFPQLEAHLKEKVLLDKCYQHIADEPGHPGTPSQISYSAVAGMVKAAAPGLRIFDAASDIIENQDVSVVVLGDNIATMPPVPEGSERWMYTCTGPQGNFANRFIQQPLIKTRLLHWINFKYNECGYLHWGFNYWTLVKDPVHDVTPDTDWPGGDCYIIYPGERKVYPSMRLWAMRDGIRDYDLLKMVEERDPERARELCNSIILGPDKYNTDSEHFNKVRKHMLEFLSEE